MKKIFSLVIKDESGLTEVVRKMKAEVPRDSILLLSGGLGAGKTTLTRCLCESFGLKMTQSPTYAIHQRYTGAGIRIDHFDLYRLESAEDVESAGVYDLLEESADYRIVEWPERIPFENYPLGKKLFALKVSAGAGGTRIFELEALN